MNQEIMTKQKEVVHFLITHNFLPDEFLLEKLKDEHKLNFIHDKIFHNNSLNEVIDENKIQNILEMEFEIKAEEKKIEAEDIKIQFSYKENNSKKRDIQDFVSYFNCRYKSIEKILRNRQELGGITTISRVLNKKDKETLSIIGLVNDKRITKTGNLMITLEDPTGEIKTIIHKNRQDLFEMSKSVVLDEIIGIVGVNSEGLIFVNAILFPEVPVNKEFKKSPEENYAVFLSDLHIGSSKFLPEEFNKFLQWINGGVDSERHKEIAKKVKYIFIIGDLVDGVGIYPNQEKELDIKDIYEQYNECARLLKKIPKSVKLIMCPGNHDSVRISEPQPAFLKEFSAPLFSIPNAVLVTNPSLVTIDIQNNFSGFDVLMYHGYSFDYYIANVDSIRTQGGYDRADLVMKFLLQKRHLAPSHTSTLYLPDSNMDPLVIERVPDFFATGHIHKSSVSNYRNITLLSGSCFQAKTAFQEKVGHHPEPARVPVINLQTREVRILRFGKD